MSAPDHGPHRSWRFLLLRKGRPHMSQTRVQAAGAATRLVFHALFATGSPKQCASSWFCSHTVHAPAKPKPLRSHSMASKPWMVRRAVAKAHGVGSGSRLSQIRTLSDVAAPIPKPLDLGMDARRVDGLVRRAVQFH